MDELAPRAWLAFSSPDGDPARLTVRVGGEFDVASLQVIEPDIEALLGNHPQAIVIDMSDLRFMDSSGIAVLIRIANRFGPIQIRHANAIIRRIIDVLGLSGRLPVEAD